MARLQSYNILSRFHTKTVQYGLPTVNVTPNCFRTNFTESIFKILLNPSDEVILEAALDELV